MQLLGHYGLPMGAAVVAGLITTAILMPFRFTLNIMEFGFDWIIYQLASIIVSLAASVLYGGLNRIHLSLARGETPVFSELFSCFKMRPDRFILASFLSLLISAGLLLPGLLCILAAIRWFQGTPLLFLGIVLLVAGLILYVVISLQIALVATLLAEHDSMGVLEAFRESFALMTNNMGRLFYLNLSFIGWQLLAILSCGLGFLWLTPYLYQTSVVFYLDVTNRLSDGNVPQEPQRY